MIRVGNGVPVVSSLLLLTLLVVSDVVVGADVVVGVAEPFFVK